jgi:NAD(P)-dependent dehydrogenase (short-subunit alcohol dehydrogenase family)
MFDFTDQVVIITGATGNLGQATAHAFYQTGAKLVLVGRKLETLHAVFDDSIPESSSTLYAAANLIDESSVADLVEAAIEQFGRIDVLLNIAGGFTMGPPVHETPVETWDFMLNLNARTVFLMSRAVVPHMLAQRGGNIVNVSARAGLAGKANMAPYVVAKSAVIRLTESMADELKNDNINVNCILPGTIDTPRNREEMPKADFSKWVAPEALADTMLFLASDAARAVTGAVLPVTGRS